MGVLFSDDTVDDGTQMSQEDWALLNSLARGYDDVGAPDDYPAYTHPDGAQGYPQPDGSIWFSDGSVLRPDGTVGSLDDISDGTPTDGTFLDNGATNNWTNKLMSLFGLGGKLTGTPGGSRNPSMLGGGGPLDFLLSRIFANKADKDVGQDIDQMFNRLADSNAFTPQKDAIVSGVMDRFNTDYLGPNLEDALNRSYAEPYADLAGTSSDLLQQLYTDPMSNPGYAAAMAQAGEGFARKSANLGRLQGGNFLSDSMSNAMATAANLQNTMAQPMNTSFSNAIQGNTAYQKLGLDTIAALSGANQSNMQGAGVMANTINTHVPGMGQLAQNSLGAQIALNPWRSGLAGLGQNMGANGNYWNFG